MGAAEFWSTGDYAVVVDLATGTGVTALAAAQQGARSVVGVDITPALLAEAERRANAAGAAVRWVEADLEDLALPSGSADVVLSTFGLVFTDPSIALPEACRLLRPGGSLVFTSWAGMGVFGAIRQVLAAFFPEAPVPWHERPETIRDVVGQEAQVAERSFAMVVPSSEHVVAMLERYSAPIILGAAELGGDWPAARGQLLAAVESFAQGRTGQTHLPVRYLVTTLRAT